MQTKRCVTIVIAAGLGVGGCAGSESVNDDSQSPEARTTSPVTDESSGQDGLSDTTVAVESGGDLSDGGDTAAGDTGSPDVTYDISGIENPNVCEILTAADVETITGVPVTVQELGGACQYDGADGLALKANVRAQAIPGVARAAAEADSTNVVEDIGGLGDEAISVVNEEFGEAFVLVSSGPYIVQAQNRNTADLAFLQPMAEAIVSKPPVSDG